MTTVEKLLMQIFDRKNFIIEQAKQRMELYDQHLASNLLIDGIAPPSWLWSPSKISDSIDVNKEVLVTRMLHQYSQPSMFSSSAKYSSYNYPVVGRDNGESSDALFMETLAFNKGLNSHHGPKVSSVGDEDHAGCTLNTAAEPDVCNTSVGNEDHAGCTLNTAAEPDVCNTSHGDQTDERIFDTCNAPDQSLARMQRSKSRQKALELRSTGKKQAETDVNHENSNDVFSCRIRMSTLATEQTCQKDQLPEFAEGCVTGEIIKDQDLGESYSQNEARGIDSYTGRVSRSRSYAKNADSAGGSLERGCSAEDCRVDCSHGAKRSYMSILDSCQADRGNKSQKSTGSYNCFESSGGNNINTGVMFQSEYSGKCVSDSSEADSSSNDARSIDNTGMGLLDNLPADDVETSLAKVNSSDVVDEGCEDRQSILGDRGNKSQKSTGSYNCFESSGGNNINTGVMFQSEYSGKCVSDSSEADSSSNDARSIDNTGMGLLDNFPADDVETSLAKVNSSDVVDEGCEDRQSISGDHKIQKGMSAIFSHGRLTKLSSSSHHNTFVGDTLDRDLTSHSAKAGVLPQSHGRSAVQSKAADEAGSVHTSSSMVHPETRSQNRASDQEISKPVHSPGIPPSVDGVADGGVLPQSHRRSALQSKAADEAGSVHTSSPMVHPVTRWQNRASHQEISKPVHSPGIFPSRDGASRSAENGELLNASAGQVIPFCETSSMPDERGDADFVVVSEVDSQDLVEQSVSSGSDDGKQRTELESLVALPLPNPFVTLEQKEVDFNILEKYYLRTPTSNSGRKTLEISSDKMICSPTDATVNIDKGISGGTYHVSTGEGSLEKLGILSTREDVPMDSSVLNVQNSLDTWTEKHAPIVNELDMPKSSLENSEAVQNCQSSEGLEEDIMPSILVDMVDPRIHHVELHLEERNDPLLNRQNEEGNWSGDGVNKSLPVPNVSSSDSCRPLQVLNLFNNQGEEVVDCLMEKVEMDISTSIGHDKINLIPSLESHKPCLEGEISSQPAGLPLTEKDLKTISTGGSPQVEELLREGRLRPSSIESWPQLKRRKIEHQLTNSCTSLPSFGMRMLHTAQRDCPASTSLKSIEMDVDPVLTNEFELKRSSYAEINGVMDLNFGEGPEAAFEFQNGEVPFCSKEHSEQKLSPTIPIVSQGDFVAEMRTSHSSGLHSDTSGSDDRHCSQHSGLPDTNVDNISLENCSLATRMLQGNKSSQLEDGLQSQCSVLSPSNNDLDSRSVDQAMPVFERFVVDAEANCDEMDFATDAIDFEKLSHSQDAIERASILAEICRSASVETPISNFSSTLKFLGPQNIFKSIPNGLLKGLDFGSTLSAKTDISKQLESGGNLVNDASDAFERMPYSDCLPYSSPRYDKSRIQQASPVGKFWERLSSHIKSSEKRSSSNPELTCFTIEEDSCIGEENEDEIADNATKENDSVSANHSDKRHPLKDLSNIGLTPQASIAFKGDILGAGRMDSVSATQDKVQQYIKNQYREEKTSALRKTDVNKKQTLSIGANGIKKAKESIHNSIMRSNRSNVKRQEQKLSLKESRRNNIVSNVSSFVPLVQQTQAVSICAGKRDVKVKSLEAAEAAKRLAEKKENERKIRKEALKLERAKLEEKNLRQMEVEKRNKELERKKKDAEIITKKRLREEEERKEKEKKRMRVEERQRQREQEEKARAEKVEKEKQRSKDEQMDSKKEYIKPQKLQNMDTVRGDAATALKKAETKSTHSGTPMNHEKCGTSGKAMNTVNKSPPKEDLIVQKSRGSSYEISPYQCSDDEDEDDDVLPTKKHVPSWASKNSVARLLPLQEEMDPALIFPLGSFCSMDEVLLSRKLRQKQVVT